MERNIILAGVGGQGILTIAVVLDQAAQELGLHFKQAEVHGMAQRGGAVQSHLRIHEQPVHSDLVPVGGADLILGVEPLETLRYVHYLRPGGAIVTSENPFVNIPDYPQPEQLFPRFQPFTRCVLLDTQTLARRAGSGRAENIVMVGAAAPDLDFPLDLLERLVAELFARKGERVVATNLQALRHGWTAGNLFRAARQADLSLDHCRRVTALLDPAGLRLEAAQPWFELLREPGDPSALDAALGRFTQPLPATQVEELGRALLAARHDPAARQRIIDAAVSASTAGSAGPAV